jgi:hypothetical protein
MLDFRAVAEQAIEAYSEVVQLVPVKHRETAGQRLDDLRSKLASAQSVGPANHMARYWENYRNSQKFLIEQFISGSDDKCYPDRTVTGYQELAEVTGLSESTLRQRIAVGHGVFKRAKRGSDGSLAYTEQFQPIQTVITRLNNT